MHPFLLIAALCAIADTFLTVFSVLQAENTSVNVITPLASFVDTLRRWPLLLVTE